jgi:hypothetical protein
LPESSSEGLTSEVSFYKIEKISSIIVVLKPGKTLVISMPGILKVVLF